MKILNKRATNEHESLKTWSASWPEGTMHFNRHAYDAFRDFPAVSASSSASPRPAAVSSSPEMVDLTQRRGDAEEDEEDGEKQVVRGEKLLHNPGMPTTAS